MHIIYAKLVETRGRSTVLYRSEKKKSKKRRRKRRGRRRQWNDRRDCEIRKKKPPQTLCRHKAKRPRPSARKFSFLNLSQG